MSERRPTGRRFKEEDKALIVQLYKDGATLNEIMEQVGCTKPTIYKYVKDEGLSRDVPQDKVQELIDKYNNTDITVAKLLKDTGISRATFYRRLKEYQEEQGEL